MVERHLEQFPNGFYSRLGARFLRVYFREYLRCSASISVAAVLPGTDHVVGYLIGNVDRGLHERDLYLRSAPVLTLAGMAALASRPGEAADFMRSRSAWYLRRYVRGVVRGLRHKGPASHVGELLYIHTTSEYRRHGCGAALLRAFVEHAQRAHSDRLVLVTEQGNLIAREFYAHRGWREGASSVARDGRTLLQLEFALGGSHA